MTTIPDKAVEAARDAMLSDFGLPGGVGATADERAAAERVATRALTAAAPMIVGAQWVSVKERMPPPHRAVWVYAPAEQVGGCEYGENQGKAYWHPEDGWDAAWEQTRTITHWRPLPPPPLIDPEAT